jgi:hypothetical protein
MVHPTAAARLVAPAGGALSLMPGLPRTAAGAVNLAAVAAAADQYLRLAASAQEQPGRPFRRRRAAAWTPSATGGIMPRHACSAPCGARRRTRAWQFRSAPCLPIGRLSSRHCALDTRRSAVTQRATQAGLWICGQRKGVAHIPTGAANDSQHQVDCFVRGTAQTWARHPQATTSRRGQVTSPRRLRHLCADTDSHPHRVRARSAAVPATGGRLPQELKT